MTDEQRSIIFTMRRQGHTYAEIAATLQVSINTVKSFYRRQNTIEFGVGNACKNCGKPITVKEKCKPRQFCSDTCRISWWRQHTKSKKTVYHLICEACGKEFTCNGNRKQRYCSHACYITARFGKERDVLE